MHLKLKYLNCYLNRLNLNILNVIKVKINIIAQSCARKQNTLWY